MADAAIAVSGLSKRYSSGIFRKTFRRGVDDVSFEVGRGEVFGCLGPNGAGKTTLLKLLLGLLRPDRGQVEILGHAHTDLGWRYRTGFLAEHPYLYDYLTAAEYLEYVGRLRDVPRDTLGVRRDQLLERLGLARARDVAVRRFSKGMVQRLGLAQALIGDPDLVFLDEPMSGLDPVGRRLVRDVILSLKNEGKTVFFSTHILPDAEALCDRVALIMGGRLRSTGRLDAILRVDVSHMEVLVSGLSMDAVVALAVPSARCNAMAERIRVEVEETHLGSLLRGVDAAGGRILGVQPIRQSLEEYFFREMAALETDTRWTTDD
jgi:ABC-2 type transport system ATP-binding protein